MELLEKFFQHCAAAQLVQPNDRLLLAVSGGIDSRVLLDLFGRLKNEWALQLAIAHVNHQLRGSESDGDEKFVRALAQDAGLPFYAERVDVLAHAREHKRSLETAARELRYPALEKCRQAWQARAIVTAHTQDDQTETILAHLLRGCGLAGLTGMSAESELDLETVTISERDKNFSQPDAVFFSEARPLKGQRRTRVLRPLLPFARAEIEAYAKFRRLQWRDDHTNRDTKFRRNRLRKELLPLIKTRFNPQIARSLEHLSHIAVAAEKYLQAEAAARLPEVIKERHSGKIILDLELFWKYFPIIQRYVIRAVMQELLRQPVEPSFAETARLLDLLQPPPAGKKSTGKRYVWRQQVLVSVDHDGAVFRKQTAKSKEQKANIFSAPVAVGEPCEIAGTEFIILVERKELPRDWREQVNANSQFVYAAKVEGELRVRYLQRSDGFVPIGPAETAGLGSGSKTVSDFFTDLKVPQHRRRTTPILAAAAIIWVCGYRLDDRFKITPATRTVLHLQLLPQSKPD